MLGFCDLGNQLRIYYGRDRKELVCSMVYGPFAGDLSGIYFFNLASDARTAKFGFRCQSR